MFDPLADGRYARRMTAVLILALVVAPLLAALGVITIAACGLAMVALIGFGSWQLV